MAGLARGGLDAAVREVVAAGRPYFGICLGLQVLFEESEEHGPVRGLGLLRGKVVRFTTTELKVPHMGWNECRRGPAGGASALADTPDGTYFYFVHSYYPAPARPEDVALWSDYGGRFCVAVARDNIFACQFHPEKSQAVGLALLGNFVRS